METDATYSRSCTAKDVGNFGDVLGLRKLDSEPECSQLPQGWNVVHKDMLLPALIAGLYTEAPHERAPVSSLAVLVSSVTSSETEIYLKVYPNLFNF